jgi:PilZ domain
MDERRTNFRMMCADVLEVSWTDQKGTKRSAAALLEDISETGACLQLEVPVAIGSEIRWSCPKQDLVGRVRYCDYQEMGYFVGVEFHAASKWSANVYEPQHLLDLQEIARRSGS